MIRKPRPNRQGSNGQRPRPHGDGRFNGNPRAHANANGGTVVRPRGNPKQTMESYLALARDALSSGDRIAAEGYFQHAEHYYRVMTADGRDHG